MKQYDLGRIISGQEIFRLAEEHLNTHMAVLGATGSGKSFFLWQLLREHRRNRRGFALFDSGDLWSNFLGDMAREAQDTGNVELLKKVHVIQLSPFFSARYDPFKFFCPTPIHPELMDSARACWQHTKVQSVAELFQLTQGRQEFEGQPRLHRMLTNVFTCVSTEVESRRLAIADAQVLIDLSHPDHLPVYNRLRARGKLPRVVVADLEFLHNCRRVQDLRTETESCLNRLRALLGPAMSWLPSGTGKEPSIDLYQIIQRGDYLIVCIQDSPYASHAQNVALARLVKHDLYETVLMTPRHKRRDFTMLLEEAHDTADESDGRAMRVMRKYKLGVVIATPDMSGLKKKEVDLAPALTGVPRTRVFFQLDWPEDGERAARLMHSGDVNFKELEQEVERDGGYVWHDVVETSASINVGVGAASAHGATATETNTTGSGTTSSDGTTQSATKTNYQSDSDGKTRLADGERGPSQKTKAEGTGRAVSDGKTHSVANSSTQTHATSAGTSDTNTASVNVGASQSQSQKKVPLHQVVREKVKTGQLERSVADQLEEKAQRITNRPKRQAVVKLPDQAHAIEIETLELKSPFVSEEALVKAVHWLLRKLPEIHPYYFVPDLDEAAKRVQEFGAPAAEDVDEPLIVNGEEANEMAEEDSQNNPFD